MMSMHRRTNIVVDLWTRIPIAASRIARETMAALAEEIPQAFPLTWGDIDPFRIVSRADDYEEALSFWRENGKTCGRFAMGQGLEKETGLLIDFLCGTSRQLHSLHFWFDHTLIADDSLPAARSVRRLFRCWINIMRPDFGRAHIEGEWVAKNVREQFEESDGTINPWKVFHQNIMEGLPGVYWLTYFGEDLVRWLGEEKIAGSPWQTVEKLGGGYLLQRSEAPSNWKNEEGLDYALIRRLGRSRFFDITHFERPVDSPPLKIPDHYIDET